MGVYIRNKLPSEYQEVEYIQSSGTQYINTGYQPNNTTEVECKLNMVSITNSWDTIYGALNTSSGASRRAFLLQIDKNTNKVWATIYSNTGSYQVAVQSINAISTNTDYTIKQSNTDFYIDGILQDTYSSSSYTVGYNMFIFGCSEGGTSISMVSMKLYSFKIYDNGALIRNLIPCYRKSDSVIGLYDLVNNQFYTNSGTGTFIKGNDVNNYYEKEMQNAYIGEVWTPGENTIAYYPLNSNTTVNDESGNGYNLTNSGATFGIYNGVDCAYLDNTNSKKLYTTIPGLSGNPTFTVNVYVYREGTTNVDGGQIFLVGSVGSNLKSYGNVIRTDGKYLARTRGGGEARSTVTNTLGVWELITVVKDGSNTTVYRNSSEIASGTINTNISATDFTIGSFNSFSGSYQSFYGYLSEFIVEDKVRTAQEVASYYNSTKSDYGL